MTIQLGRKHGLIGTDHNDPLLEGEDLSHTIGHGDEIEHLVAVLKYLFRGEKVAIVTDVDINLRVALAGEDKFRGVYKSPDIAVIDGLESRDNKDLATYYIGPGNPPPRVVFEIASDGTWFTDLEKKPNIYAEMGIREYFTYDPNLVWTGLWRKRGQLLGWKLNPNTGKAQEIPLEAKGLWSNGLQSWVRLDADKNLRLYEDKGELRLTEAEAEYERAEAERQRAESEKRRAEVERQRAESEKRRAAAEYERAEVERNARLKAETERLRIQAEIEAERRQSDLDRQRMQAEIEAERRRAEAVRQRVEAENAATLEAERQQIEKLRAKLRELGQNPDDWLK